MLLTGQSAQLYLPERQHEIHDALGKPEDLFELYLNPPAYALMMMPFALLPYATAFNVWRLLGLLAAAFSMMTLARALGHKSWWDWLLVLVASFAGFEVVAIGQSSFFFLAIHCWTLALLMEKRDVHAGLILSLGLLKPQLFWPLPIVLFLRRRWRFVAGLAIGGTLVVAANLLVGGPALIRDFIAIFRSPYYLIGIQSMLPKMQSLSSFIRFMFGEGISPFAATAIVATPLCLTFGMFVLTRTDDAQRVEDLYGLAVVVTLLVSPHLFRYYLVLLAVPIAVCYTWISSGRVSWPYSGSLRLVFVAFFWLPFLHPIFVPIRFQATAPVMLVFALLIARLSVKGGLSGQP